MQGFYIEPNCHMDTTKKSVFLIGGFVGWWNFGDFMQLKSILLLYKNKGYFPYVFVFSETVKNEENFRFLKNIFSDVCFVSLMDDAYKLREWVKPSVENMDVLHLYGGGFLNEYWGKSIIEVVERALNRFKPYLYIITGQQISKKVVKHFSEHVNKYSPELIGVRDFESLKNLEEENISAYFSWDDSVEEILRIKNKMKSLSHFNNCNTVGIHINLSNYVASDLSLVKRDIKNILEYNKNRKIIFFQAYDRDSVIVKDTSKSLDYLGILGRLGKVEIVDLMGYAAFNKLDNLKDIFRSLCCVFSNSYHVALFFAILGIPSYLMRFNRYYSQKHKAVMGCDVGLDSFLENIENLWEIQREWIEKNKKERVEFLEELDKVISTIEKNNKKTFDFSYTFEKWPVETDIIENDIDSYVESLLDKIKNYDREKNNLLDFVKSLKNEIEILEQKKERLEDDLDKKRKWYESQLNIIKRHNKMLISENKKLKEELWNIWNSNAWKMVDKYYNLKKRKWFYLLSSPIRFIITKTLRRGR